MSCRVPTPWLLCNPALRCEPGWKYQVSPAAVEALLLLLLLLRADSVWVWRGSPSRSVGPFTRWEVEVVEVVDVTALTLTEGNSETVLYCPVSRRQNAIWNVKFLRHKGYIRIRLPCLTLLYLLLGFKLADSLTFPLYWNLSETSSNLQRQYNTVYYIVAGIISPPKKADTIKQLRAV